MYRVSFFWNQQSSRLGGWTENFWNNAGSYAQAVQRANALFPLLVDIHGTQPFCQTFRVSSAPLIPSIAAPRLSGLIETAYIVGQIGTPGSTTDADYPSTALLLNLSSGGTPTNKRGPVNRRQWIRGIQDGSIRASGRLARTAAYGTLLDNLTAHLENDANGWVQRILDPAFQPVQIDSFFPATGVINATAHLIPVGQTRQVRISGFTEPLAINGMHWVKATTADALQTLNWDNLPSVVASSKRARLRQQVFVAPVISEAKFERSTSHYTGRPTNTLGGRR